MNEITQWMDSMKGYLQAFGYTTAAVCVIIAAFIFMTSGERGMEKGKKWILGIAIGVGLLSLGGSLITTLQG